MIPWINGTDTLEKYTNSMESKHQVMIYRKNWLGKIRTEFKVDSEKKKDLITRQRRKGQSLECGKQVEIPLWKRRLCFRGIRVYDNGLVSVCLKIIIKTWF